MHRCPTCLGTTIIISVVNVVAAIITISWGGGERKQSRRELSIFLTQAISETSREYIELSPAVLPFISSSTNLNVKLP